MEKVAPYLLPNQGIEWLRTDVVWTTAWTSQNPILFVAAVVMSWWHVRTSFISDTSTLEATLLTA